MGEKTGELMFQGPWDHREPKHLKGREKVLGKFEFILALTFLFPRKKIRTL